MFKHVNHIWWRADNLPLQTAANQEPDMHQAMNKTPFYALSQGQDILSSGMVNPYREKSEAYPYYLPRANQSI